MPVLPSMPLPGSPSSSSSVTGQIAGAFKSSVLGSVGLSQASNRQNVADMFQYSQRAAGMTPKPVLIYPNASNDWRVRVTLAPGSNYFYNDPNNTLLSPLVTELGGGSTNPIASNVSNIFGLGGAGARRVGVIFPYTPQLQVTHTANYSPQKLTHNNYTQYFYDNSEVQAISINADFTVQNVNEGQYLLACIYFFRSVTKMFFGQDPDGMAGNPPPMVYLNGYGQYYLPNVPCVVTSFSHTMPADVDYMDIPEPGMTAGAKAYNPQFTNPRLNSTRLPTTSSITLSLQPVYSRTAQTKSFSLNDFASGALIGFPGGAGATSAFGRSQSPSFAKSDPLNGGFI